MTVVEEETVAKRSTGDIFASRYGEFGRDNPEEFKILQKELDKWGLSVVVASGLSRGENREEIIDSHIDHVVAIRAVEGRPTSGEEFVEEIFSSEPGVTITADEIMRRLQAG